jgi:succinate-acetate transporter protein
MRESTNTWADPSPAGLMALAIATFGFFAVLTGRVAPSGLILFAMWLFGGFIVHLFVGIIKTFKGESVDANAFVFFSAYLMLVAGLEFIVKWLALKNGWEIDMRMSGYVWIPLWLAIWLWSPAIFKEAPLVFNVAVFAADIAFPIICLTTLGVLAPSYVPIAGYSLLVTGIMCLYLGGAAVVNATFQKGILPVGAPILHSPKSKSM